LKREYQIKKLKGGIPPIRTFFQLNACEAAALAAVARRLIAKAMLWKACIAVTIFG
jgi:hypothetical protein